MKKPFTLAVDAGIGVALAAAILLVDAEDFREIQQAMTLVSLPDEG